MFVASSATIVGSVALLRGFRQAPTTANVVIETTEVITPEFPIHRSVIKLCDRSDTAALIKETIDPTTGQAMRLSCTTDVMDWSSWAVTRQAGPDGRFDTADDICWATQSTTCTGTITPTEIYIASLYARHYGGELVHAFGAMLPKL